MHIWHKTWGCAGGGGVDNTSKDISRSTDKIGMWMMFMYKVGKNALWLCWENSYFQEMYIVFSAEGAWCVGLSLIWFKRESSNTIKQMDKTLTIVASR